MSDNLDYHFLLQTDDLEDWTGQDMGQFMGRFDDIHHIPFTTMGLTKDFWAVQDIDACDTPLSFVLWFKKGVYSYSYL